MAAVDHHGAFGQDVFGRWAEKTARFFGTPQYIVGQTVVVAIWVVLNSVAVINHWDPYPFILLNLGFSLQAAYAAPLILLAQTRQADRDKVADDATEAHREREEKWGVSGLRRSRRRRTDWLGCSSRTHLSRSKTKT